jgi:thymidylate synthase (FAD)
VTEQYSKTVYHVLDHGLVSLEQSMGSDLAIVNAAQASFDRLSTSYGERERAILRKLMAEEHGVPFEHAAFTFKLRLPLFLAAQFKKHRHGSWSEHSARYSPMVKCFYEPGTQHVRSQVGRPMEYTFEQADETKAELFRSRLRVANEQAWSAYEDAVASGVAKEQARLALPVNLYTTAVWTMNARALFNFLRLRLDGHAQEEAQVYAEAMLRAATPVIPDTMQAFIDAGYPKP